jgi:putative ABC transport system permease protein
MRDNAQRSINNTVRDSLTCAFFLFVVVFLGFLGTFWFRTQQRVPEIALRMVNGATRRQIFARLISEGLIMLGVSVLIFAPIFMAVVDEVSFVEIAVESNIPKYVALTMTILLLAIVIVAGVWFPARRAMNIQPANALKDQ